MEREVTKPLQKILKILELWKSFHIPYAYSTPVDCEEGSIQTSLRKTTFYLSEPEKSFLNSLEKVRFPRIGTSEREQNEISHITAKELIEKMKRNHIKSEFQD